MRASVQAIPVASTSRAHDGCRCCASRTLPSPAPATERGSVDAFAVEYYRTLCSGLPREVFKAAMFTPAPTGRAPKTGKDKRKKATN